MDIHHIAVVSTLEIHLNHVVGFAKFLHSHLDALGSYIELHLLLLTEVLAPLPEIIGLGVGFVIYAIERKGILYHLYCIGLNKTLA